MATVNLNARTDIEPNVGYMPEEERRAAPTDNFARLKSIPLQGRKQITSIKRTTLRAQGRRGRFRLG